MRFLPVSQNVILVELDDLNETLALLDSLERQPVAGIEELVPAAQTLMVRFRRDALSAVHLAERLANRDIARRAATSGPLIEIPVRYDGEDLLEVAELLGTSADEVIRRHTENEYTVAFTGFAPGFAYMTAIDAGLDVPRRKIPRTRIPAGAVGLAGPFSGIYPRSSPGGWQIIGVTPLAMFDLSRATPALLQPGYRVRFVDMARAPLHVVQQLQDKAEPDGTTQRIPTEAATDTALRVITADTPVTFQDLGRPGIAGQGVSASGALDRRALKTANRIVGNQPGTPCLEISFGGFSFEAVGRTVIAVTGADAPITIKTAAGHHLTSSTNVPIGLDDGDVVKLAAPVKGMRSYLAVRGGFAVAPVLGSAATDTLAGLGPAAVAVDDRLGVRSAESATAVSPGDVPAFELPAADDVVSLDVVMGPRTDWFSPSAVELLQSQAWQVTPQSSRVGIRLAGERSLERSITRELPSEGTVTGAIQVPPSGQPVLFLADHPLTGGYPVIATVAEHHLDLAGQIPIGAHIRFNPLQSFQEIAASRSGRTKARHLSEQKT